MFFREIRLVVRFATAPFSNSILAVMMSGVGLTIDTPLALIDFIDDFTIVRRMSMS